MDKDKTEKSKTALREEKILEFWKENDIFNKTLEKKENSKGEFIFWDGPPTANGKPGIHHLEARAFKDAIPRYKTMQGFHVRRKGGWDTHGLPVELQVEKELGLKSKKEVEQYGVVEFNKKCKESVWKYIDEWERFTNRIGFWVDHKNPYVTYKPEYMESVWNVIKKISEQDLIYKDYKILPWCPRCGTGLSSHELGQPGAYQDDKDLSVVARFKILDERFENTYILAWTTTPWTLPGNVALAVGEDIEYVKISLNGEFLILAKERLSVVEEEYKIISEIKGKELIGLSYEPLYAFMSEQVGDSQKEAISKAYKIYGAGFVTTTDGTGVVHTAVMYGQDDFELGNKIGLPKYHIVNLEGKFVPDTGFLEGRFVKDEEVVVDIIKDLAHRGLLFKKEKYEHSYPHCWRCNTALIYYARDSWYIKMTEEKIKKQLIDENQKINWEPSYIKEGRFGEWLKDIKDWAISRERYWGTPLPIWSTESGKFEFIGSIDGLKKKTKKSGNKYFVMRHGETDDNISGLVSCDPKKNVHLNENGKKQVLKSIEDFKTKNIDIIFMSDFVRAKDTAEIISEKIGISKENIFIDERLREMQVISFQGKFWEDYHNKYSKLAENFEAKNDGDESHQDLKNRVAEFLYEIEENYQYKNILIVTHGGPAWLLFATALGCDAQKTIDMVKEINGFHFFKNAEVKELDFVSLPHNENYELDLHKPYIDNIKLISVEGEEMTRVKEVMDVWFDSGAMPFAQDHYPFENKEWVDQKGVPADFISEGMDQTRGWFYTLHAISVLMGKGIAYKNVICLGLILDEKGKKMSKSIGNVVDPWVMADKYGADTLRLWMYSVNQPGDSKNFDEKTVMELHRQVFGLLYNVLAFYELYRDKDLEKVSLKDFNSNNILDQWILARLILLTEVITTKLDSYKLLEPVREIKSFIDDLSTWYVRRSRERLKDGDKEAKQTLYLVLKGLMKLIAPFVPFTSEDIWQKLKTENDIESIHLCSWPEVIKMDTQIIDEMRRVREVVTLGLDARQNAGIKVRQPLSSLKVKDFKLKVGYSEIIKDELNIKNIIEDSSIKNEVQFDLEITPDLKLEGDYRELLRGVQDTRKKIGLMPEDKVVLILETDEKGKEIIQKFETEFKKTAGISEIKFEKNDGDEIKVNEVVFKITIIK